MTRQEKIALFRADLMRQGSDPEENFVAWMIYFEREFGLTKEQMLKMPMMEFLMKREQLISWRKERPRAGGKTGRLFR